MALDILLIPVMSADPERLFSSVKITILDRRNRLRIYTIKALECLKSWLKILLLIKDDDKDGEVKGGDNTGENTIEGPITLD